MPGNLIYEPCSSRPDRQSHGPRLSCDRRGFDTLDLKSYEGGMTTDHHSRSDIVRRAGVDNDVLTFWLRRDLIRPIEKPSGRGNALRFDPYQVRVAKVLANARAAGLNLDALNAIAFSLQGAIKTFMRAEVSPTMLPSIMHELEYPGSFQEALAASKSVYAIRPMEKMRESIARKEQPDYENQVVDAARKYSAEKDTDGLWLFIQMIDADGYLMVYRQENDEWKAERHSVLDGAPLPAPVCILIDFASLKPLSEDPA